MINFPIYTQSKSVVKKTWIQNQSLVSPLQKSAKTRQAKG